MDNFYIIEVGDSGCIIDGVRYGKGIYHMIVQEDGINITGDYVLHDKVSHAMISGVVNNRGIIEMEYLGTVNVSNDNYIDIDNIEVLLENGKIGNIVSK